MGPGNKGNRVAWLFVVTLVVLCGSLTVLQYCWTGKLARAEITHLQDSLSQKARMLCNAFDAELVASRAALVPTTSELDGGQREEVYAAKIRKWNSRNPRPLFKRMAVAVVDGETVLLEADMKSGRLVKMTPPKEWEDLISIQSNKRPGRPPRFTHGSGFLREFPVMDEKAPPSWSECSNPDDKSERGKSSPKFGWPGRGEREGGRREWDWVILELDTDYFRKTWMPDLVATYLNPQDKLHFDVLIRSKRTPDEVIFSTGPASLAGMTKPLAIDFHYFGSDPQRIPPGFPGARWVMEIRHRPGSLEAVVATTRRWNLAVAAVLNGLILACGWMLLLATRRSRKVAEERMRFVANVTHELRTPLTVIRGAAHNLKRGIIKDPNAVDTYAGLILDHAESLGEMVDQVLLLSGGRRGQAVREPVELGPVLHAAVQTVRNDPRFSANTIDLRIPGRIPIVMGDPAALRRAFHNLVENAAKHGGPGTRVEITLLEEDHCLKIMISDQGPGIPASEMDEIFEPFFRGSRARSGQVRGSGLGLSVVKGIVVAHGGDVSVNSETGSGSTFTVSLPVPP